MSDDLYFEPGYYTVTKFLSGIVIEIDNTWFVKLKGIEDKDADATRLKEFIDIKSVIKVIPRHRNEYGEIVSDIWLGDAHINRQFSSYKHSS